MKPPECNRFGIVTKPLLHLEKIVAKGIVAGIADRPWFGIAKINEDEGKFGGTFHDGSTEFVGGIGPRHHVDVGTFGFVEQRAFSEGKYFGESDPKLLVHGGS